jgi:plasma-membrane proton-efflux P-type ATPase
VRSVADAVASTARATLASLGSSAETGLGTVDAAARLSREGPNDVPEPRRHPFVRFAKKFSGLSAWMIEAIAALSWFLHKSADFYIALGLLVANALLSTLHEQRASAAVAALRGRLRVTARALRDRVWTTVAARDLVRGDVVRVRAGDFVPGDLQLIEGSVVVDQSSLTGESRELDRAHDEVVYAGATVKDGEATAVVVATGARTYFGRTTQLVESARPRLRVEEVISRVVRWLLYIVGTLVAVTLVTSSLEGLPLVDILPLALVLLMSAVPVALPVMFTVTMAVGSMELARRGVLVTRLSAAEDAATMDVVCADKTGTLTLNRLVLAGALPEPGFVEDDVVRDGALASNEADRDSIDIAFLSAARDRGVVDRSAKVRSFVPFSAKTRRTEAVVDLDGRSARVLKGALRTLAAAVALDSAALAELEARADEAAKRGFRVLAVARADGDQPLRLVGLALLRDAPRPDSRQLIDELRALDVAVKMLTGDAIAIAREVAADLGLGEVIDAARLRPAGGASAVDAARLVEGSSGFAEVFPEDKYNVVKVLQAADHVVGMTGDGVNDAPALRQAEVGIAVSNATDVAKGAASVVLTSEGLTGIIDLVKGGRAIYQRVLTWIVNKVSRTILKAGFVVIAFLVTGKFVISALGMILVVFMTDFVKIALSTDRVRPSQRPETWNIGPLVVLAAILGVSMLIEALGLLAFAWHRFGLAEDSGRLQTFTFQTLLFFALFSIVSIRERRAFWKSRPSTVLGSALLADGVLGLLIGLYGLADLRPLPLRETAVILGVAAVCSLGLNDFIKTSWTTLSARTAAR